MIKDRFPEFRQCTLRQRADGPFKMLEKINEIAYTLVCTPDFETTGTSIISDLEQDSLDYGEIETRMSALQEGEAAEKGTSLSSFSRSMAVTVTASSVTGCSTRSTEAVAPAAT